MLKSSLNLILTSGVQAGIGFAFWIIVARLFATEDVGRASSLISATNLMGFLSLLGLNTTFVRYLPAARNRRTRDRLITAGLILVATCGGAIALGYAFLTPLVAPRISFITHSPLMLAGFVILTASGGVNILTDAVFIASERTSFNAVTDGVVAGATRITMAIAMVGAGSYGIFSAATSGYVTAAIVSIVLMYGALRWRPAAGSYRKTLKPLLSFSGANYVGNVLVLLPNLVVPLIVLDRIGPDAAAYYYVSFQIASLLFQAVYAVEQSFLASGAHKASINRAFLMRSVRILAALCLPSLVLTIILGRWVLSLFGEQYGLHAYASLVPLALTVLPIAVNNWMLTVLRLANKLQSIMVSNVCYAAAICGLAWFLAPRGLGAMATAWPIGVAVGTLAAAGPAIGVIHRKRNPRHAAAFTNRGGNRR